MNSTKEDTLEDFQKGKSVGTYRTSTDGGVWEFAAYSQTENLDQENGIDVVGDNPARYLFTVETQDVRMIDGDIQGREYLDPTFEYEVSVEVFNESGEEPIQEGETMVHAGSTEQTSADYWATQAVQEALGDEAPIESVDTGVSQSSNDSSTEIVDLLNEEEPTGLDAIDTVRTK